MNLERILIILILVAAILAAIPQITVSAQIWGVILVVLGLIAGATSSMQGDITQRLAVYVIAAVLPTISNSLDTVWVVGPWLNSMLDNMATGLQGMALALFVMAVVGRIMPAPAAGTNP